MWNVAVTVWVWTTLTVLVPAQSSPPVITDFLQKDLVNPEDVKFRAKVGFRLPCKATGSNLKWTWEHNGTGIAAYNGRPFLLSENGTLTGNYLLATDGGTYQCFVRDEATGAVVFSRKLKVAVTVVGAFINPTNVVVKVNLGEPFSYDCPPRQHTYGVVYSWGNADGSAQHTFARNERRAISSNGTLFIMYLKQEDIDEIESYKGIRCVISGANSFQRSGTLRLEKIDKDQKDSENSTLPAWLVTPNAKETAVQGRNKTLYCFASGRPPPTVTWKKDGRRLQHDQNSFKIPRSFYGRRLFIHNVDKVKHEGTYTCEASNDLNTDNPISFNLTLNVEAPPKWAADPPPRNITIVIKKNGTLECKVTANPAATVSWYKDGQQLQPSQRLTLADSKLHLIDVNLNDAGVYQCEAVNDHGMIISSTWIRVSAWKPSFANVQFGPFHLLNEKEATLPCKPSTAAPRPTYEWFKNGDLITYEENSRYRLQMDGALVIKKVDKDQDGVNYTCKAKNFMGEDSVTTVPVILVPPTLTTKPMNQTIIEGSMATFYCTASGYPNPKITWIKDGKILATGDTLSFETNRTDSGKYWCSAENGLNVTVDASASLNVLYKPRLATVPTDKTIIEDTVATFHCVATGNPTPKITWIKDGKTVGIGDTVSFKANRSQSGKYWCSAENGLNSTVNASAYLDVQFPPSLMTKPTDQIIMENDALTLHCTATGNPTPKITWIKDGKTVGEGDELSFKPLRSQTGRYWCSAENGLDITVNASAYLDVQFGPSLITTPADQTVIETDTATFYCNATGNPTPKITWIKDGMTLGEGNTLSIETNRNHSGKYWCLAENGLNSTANASANLDVQYPPSLESKPSDETVFENQEVTFHCTATGHPTPEITWTKDGNPVGLGETLSFKANRDRTGKYWCSADNGLDVIANASAYLDVQFAPSLITTPADLTVIESDTVTFFCNATGNPTPKITWIKDGKTVGQGNTLSIETNRNHSGKYWCIAENGLNSTVNASASLDVQYPPSLTTKPSDQTIIENREVTFHCTATGNPTPQLRWTKDGNTVGLGETLSFKANRDHTGKYWCSAQNGLGVTANASAYLYVQFVPSFITTPADLTVIEPDTATFYCNATGNPTPKITWIKDGKTVGGGNTLTFETNRNHSGKYWCIAENGLSSAVNASASLDVQYPPSLATKPSDATIIEHQEVTFHCTATGNPTPKITWTKDGIAVGLGERLSFKANRDHSGKYWCSAENGLDITVNTSASLNVQFAPSIITTPADQTVIESNTATFYCNATGNPTPKIIWIKDGKTVGQGNTLSIETNRNHSGKYWCLAENGLNSTANDSAILDVQFPPSLNTKPSDQIIMENQEVIFHCTATGNPTPEITWTKDGENLALGDTLSFRADRSHSRKYWCSAKNGLDITVNASASLDVQFAPSLITTPANQVVIESDTTTFHCNATGNPTPKITWIKDGQTVGEGDTLSFVTNRNHSGKYWCIAENGLNSTVNSSANLDVQFPPSLTTKPSDQTIMEKEQLTFHCTATGNPTPTVGWIKDGEAVGLGDILSFKANRNDSGKYWCLAENGLASTANASASLDVQFAPSLIMTPADLTVIESDTATFYCNATGNPTPKITWIKDGRTVGEGNTLSIETNRNHSGKYLCSAENGLSSAVNASANLDVQFPPNLITKPSNVTILENEILRFQCTAVGNPVPKIKWIKDGKSVGGGDTLAFGALRSHSGIYWCLAENGLNFIANASAYLNVQFAPSLSTRPTDQTILEASNVTFHCSATGNPTPKITWIKDGKTVATGGTLSMKANRNHSGKYWCSADNGLSSVVNASANLDVQFPPRLTTKPSDQIIIENQEVTFHCTATGNPNPQITWIKEGNTVAKGDSLSLITNRDQSGKYWCLAENGLNLTVNASANLNVQFLPSLTTRPSNQTVLEASNVTFHCTAIGNPVPKVTWAKDGKTLASGETLSFKTDRNASGVFWCSADNGLNSTVNASAHLDVQYLPSFSSVPTDQTVNEADIASFQCTATGNPAPKITWLKDGKTVATGDTLSFKALRNQSGKYWCLVENGLETVINASAYLDVQFAPSLTTWPSNLTIDEADEATFQCIATGNPTPKITWIKDGRTVGEGDSLRFKANRTNSGKYWCLAENGFSTTVNASAFLNVQFPPSFTAKAVNKTVIESDDVTFHCTATGNPVPRITWIKDGKTVGSGETLRFTALRNHSGIYWCSVDNGLNVTVKARTFLNVQYPPSFVIKPVDQTVKESDEVSFYCNATGNPTPMITWIKDGKTVAKEDTLSFTAYRNQSGKYWCLAENGLGLSINASANLDIQFPPSLTTKPVNQTAREHSVATFRCTAIGNPVPEIKWIKDGKTVHTGDVLSFAVERNQSGKYWCTANNGFDTVANASAYLDVLFPPSLTVQPTDQIVNEGAMAIFHCTATGNPTPKITWTKDGRTVGEGDTLSIETNRNHAGIYLCSAENGLNSTVSTSANLDVQFSPSIIVKPTDKTVAEGDIAAFHCNATGNPMPKITWIKERKTVATGDTLSFTAGRNQSGKYWCLADNGFNKTDNASVDLNVQFPPSLTTIPINQTVNEDDLTIFHCAATGNPSPTITWIKDGRTVGEGDTLRFETNRNHSGKYWCSAENGLGLAINTSAHLDVQFAPILTTYPTNQTVTEGNMATFHCSASGNPVPTITWIKDERTAGIEEILSFEARKDDSGEYFCIADNGFSKTANASAYLNVQFPPSFINVPSDQTVTESDETTFYCKAAGNPTPKITWIKDGKTVSSEDTFKFVANRNDSGRYWCTAENGLNVVINVSASLDVQFTPSFILKPTDQTVIEGDIAIISCTATGNPMPKITWIKDGMTVTTGDTLGFEAFRNQSGKYWCLAENGLNVTVNTSAYIDVQFPPSFTTTPTDQTVQENGEAAFHCNAIGNPTPTITWIKDGKAVGLGDTLRFKANRNHSGKYWCSAENGLDVNVNASASLDVQFSPSLIRRPTNDTVIEGAQATFHCAASGNPTPTIKWIKDGRTVATGDTLTFKTNRSQSGKYWCLAENGLTSTANASAILDVQFLVSSTSTPVDQTIREGDEATFHCTATGNPTPEITWLKDGKIVDTGDTLTFVANRNDSGQYWCSAENGLNVAINVSATLDVQFSPSFTLKPTDQTVIEGDLAIISCAATGNPMPKITWIKDGTTVATGDTLAFEAFRNQSGKYWCLAENGLNVTVNTSAYIDVQFPPSFTTIPTDQTVQENGEAAFHCNAIGNPTPTITWLKDGKAVGLGDTLRFKANRNHSGKYWCSAENGLDVNVNASASLDVQFSPSLIRRPTNDTVIEGAQATFHCSASGNPTPTIKWIKDGRTVATGDTLTFKTNRSQSGKYWCLAENGLTSTANASAYLDVQFLVSFTSTPVDQTIREGDEATFHCTATGNPTPKITWQKDGKTVDTGDMLTFVANRNDSGQYWCLAENGLDRNISANAVLDVQLSPRLITTLSNITVIEGAITRFHCNATGNPTPKITWIKDGKTVGQGNTLSIEANRNHSGKYWCLAENGLSSTVNDSAYLNVQFHMSFTTIPSDQTIREGDKTTFHCTATGNPIPKITWLKDGRTVATGNTLSFTANRSQSGRYWCLANNGLDLKINASALLDVQFSPTIITRPINKTVTEGAIATLLCEATGNPTPKITWIKDGKTVGEGDTLSIKANRTDSGKYLCSAENGLNSTVNASASLDVQFPPHFTTKPVDQTVNEDDETTFHCSASGNPVPNIKWIKDGMTVATGDTLNFKTNRSDSGQYWCLAENGLDVEIKASTQLNVQYSPSWITRPTNKTVIEGSMATFHCNAIGNPAPNISWIKDEKSVATGNTLSFKSSRNQSGEYWCSAKNGLKTVNTSFNLDVQFPPSFTSKPTDNTVKEGEEATFHCTATANPTPKITWLKDGKTVASGDTYKFAAYRNQSGQYWCSIENDLGVRINTSANLDVQYPPSCTVSSTYQTVIEGHIATFHCNATGNPTPEVSWIKDGMTVASGDTLSLIANRNDSGEYWCSAQNTFATIAKARSYLDVHFKPERTHLSVNADITRAVKFGSSVKLNCTAESHPAVDEYRFFRDQELLGSNSSGVYHLELQRSGFYSCVAVNSAGRGDNATLYISVKAWKPSFLGVTFGPFYLFKDSQARLPCKPLGEPQPAVKWFKDDIAITYGQNTSYRLEADGTLIINKVKDGDGGRYTCMAQNYLGKANITAPGILLERTKIVVKPQNRTVTEGTSVFIHCKATADSTLELRYIWKKDGADITHGSKIQLLEGESVLKIPNITVDEAGFYKCVAYTPEPKGSEDSAFAIIAIKGVPSPPHNLQLTDCYNRQTNLSWTPVASNDSRVTYFLIDQETNHEPSVFKFVYNVTTPNATSVTLSLPGWANLRFRVRAGNNFGPSRPSLPTAEGICTTSVGTPEKYPANLRGVPKKANELSITWTPMPKDKWSAPGCYYILKHRKVNGHATEWIEEKIGDPSVGVFALTNPGYYQLWEFMIRAGNHEGPGPDSPVVRSYSGQNPPAAKPESTQVGTVTDSTVTLAWKPVTIKRGSVDGYKIYYWGESRTITSRRKRRAVPSSADSLEVQGGNTRQATLTGLKPYTSYVVVVKAFNSGGEGPASATILFETKEGEPGPPSDLQIYPFGEYLLVKWTPPKDPNGIITNYQVGSAEYDGSSPENVVVAMETVEHNERHKLLSNEKFETSYVVELRARTSKGWGASLRTTTRTIKRSAPAKPEKPTVVGTGKGALSVMYNFGVGGGWTHEFKVLFRKKAEGEIFQETAWVNHFSTEWTEINNLDPELYEFKTIGKNTVGTSPESDVTEARPPAVIGPVVGKLESSSMYQSDWFITLIILSAGALLLLLIVVLVKRNRRRRSSNFKVSEHEKEIEKEKELPAPVDFKPREDWRGRLEEMDRESHDSLDEYGGDGAYFTEDGSFVGEISGNKKESAHEEAQHPEV